MSVSFSRKKLSSELIRIGGVTPFTTIDYPGELSAVLFLQGCPWRCDYCHNKDFIERQQAASVGWESVLDFLRERKTLLDAVVFSGGEPTLQTGLSEAIQQVRHLGFKIGLHTAGVYPKRLKKLLPWLDWVGLDIKAPKSRYSAITGVSHSAERAWESAKLLTNSGVDYEIRTTLHPKLISRSDLYQLVDELKKMNVRHYSVQKCNTKYCSDSNSDEQDFVSLDQDDVGRIGGNFSSFEYR
ncbi:MAG: anaerobic ribonucleoside-triphosphate reductase activating protein [Gammaproteobacteria bacterium]|nr:anaerobic ribonucleoside-triphosphate reductase activating protein [Gammaproteobacteria bacterium]